MSPAKRPTKKPARSAPKKHAAHKKGGGRGAVRSKLKDLRKRAPKAGKPTAGPHKPAENPRAKALAKRIAELVLDKKARDVVILDVRGKTSYADYFVLASGDSDRQVSAMAEHVTSTLRQHGERPVGTEGEETGNWVLLDYGEVVGHLFFSEVRAFYDLDGLWADAPREQVA